MRLAKITLLFLILSTSVSNTLFATEIVTKSTLKEVTVFLSRAQLTIQSSTSIQAGTTDIVLSDQTAFIIPNSIQVSGKGEFTIMSVRHVADYLNKTETPSFIKVIQDSIESIDTKMTFNNSMLEVLKNEKDLILTNKNIKGQNTNLTASELEDMADFFRDRFEEILLEENKYRVKNKKLNEQRNNYQNQINEWSARQNTNTSSIVVTVSAKAATTASLTCTYISTNATWIPMYDVRVKDTKSPIQFLMKAQVIQTTGMDWKNVHVKLSTNNPSIGGTKPELAPWYVNIFEPVVYKKNKAVYRSAPSMSSESMKEEDMGAAYNSYSFSIADVTTENIQTFGTEYDIAIPYSIPTGDKGQYVDIKSYEMAANYVHYVVPKMEQQAYLTAQINDWESFNLLSGKTNIYFEGNYVGESMLDVKNSSDTLTLSLGVDNKVVVERNVIKDYTAKKAIGSNKRDYYGYETIIRNTKKEAIQIVIEDQIPLSQNSQIVVENDELSGGELNTTTGKVVWKATLNPTDKKSIVLKYNVKYPKDKVLNF
jgi:uncharacterized protein (TIGR02231 family)